MTVISSAPPRAPFYYLASPYSRYPAGLEQAFIDVNRVAARLIRRGYRLYCPIAHSHPIAIHGGLDPLDHGLWLPCDQPMMNACEALLVAMLPGWGESYGVKVEIDDFAGQGKPVYFLNPETLEI